MIKPTPTIAFHTLGCRLNQSETAVLERSFGTKTYRVVGPGQPADIVVINTCTVTENGDADTRKIINKVNRLNPRTQIALIGCHAQVQKEQLAVLPNVRWIVGNGKKMALAEILDAHPAQDTTHVITPPIRKESFTVPVAGIDPRHTRVNIKIQDGCDFFCSFCEIPYARGRARSREFSDIEKEARELARSGHKEIVITGINVGTYADGGKTLLDVIDALEQIDGLERIRISSIEPTTINKKLLKRMGGKSKLCRHLHIPLQSGDDAVLMAMKRKYTVAEFNDFIQSAAAAVPELCLGTDVIVGFPGETDAHFARTEKFLRESPIHYFHVFSYSQRHLAKSRHLGNPAPANSVQKRSKILRDVSQRKRRTFYESLLGTKQTVLFEEKKDGRWIGTTGHYVKISVKSEKALKNQFRDVRLTSVGLRRVNGVLIS